MSPSKYSSCDCASCQDQEPEVTAVNCFIEVNSCDDAASNCEKGENSHRILPKHSMNPPNSSKKRGPAPPFTISGETSRHHNDSPALLTLKHVQDTMQDFVSGKLSADGVRLLLEKSNRMSPTDQFDYLLPFLVTHSDHRVTAQELSDVITSPLTQMTELMEDQQSEVEAKLTTLRGDRTDLLKTYWLNPSLVAADLSSTGKVWKETDRVPVSRHIALEAAKGILLRDAEDKEDKAAMEAVDEILARVDDGNADFTVVGDSDLEEYGEQTKLHVERLHLPQR